MLTKSRLSQVGFLLLLFAAACGGSSGALPGTDAATNADTSVPVGDDDSSPGTVTDDGSTAMGDAATVDATTTSDAAGADAATGDAGAHDAATGDAAAHNGATCATNGDCMVGHCVSGICCATPCTGHGVCQTNIGATCAGGSTCVYPNAADSTACDDGNACTTGDSCHAGACTPGTATNCDDSNACTDDSCDMALGCKHQNNTAACDDGNPCTTGDVCAAGLCQPGTAKDCSTDPTANDQCNVGACNAAGTCVKSPKADSTPCNDTLNCTATDVCTGGACTGSGDSCGANAASCTEGNPKTCNCLGGYVSTGGQCVPTTDECAAAQPPCVAAATCNDPSSAPSNVVCTCPAGFTGDGKVGGTGCTEIDNCASNPCGAGGTCTNGINTHTCSCIAGEVSVNGACVCDMNGTFASQFSFTTSWSGLPSFENGTNVPSTQWALRTQTYDSSGNLVIKTSQCGGTTFDLCETSTLIGLEAYAQFIPGPVYGTQYMPVMTQSFPFTNALAGQAYTEGQSAILLGISLTDPLGAWPAANTNIGSGANQTNGAIWVDNDNDTFDGVTSYAVPPGGIASSTAPYPLQTYGATSAACPRSDPNAARDPYNYLVGLDPGLVRVKRLYSAQRVISSLSGTINTCDSTGVTLIEGTVGGPDNGQAHVDGRVGGCVRVNGAGESNCDTTLTNDYDGQSQTEHITSGSFIIKRVPNTTTCANVQTMSFP